MPGALDRTTANCRLLAADEPEAAVRVPASLELLLVILAVGQARQGRYCPSRASQQQCEALPALQPNGRRSSTRGMCVYARTSDAAASRCGWPVMLGADQLTTCTRNRAPAVDWAR